MTDLEREIERQRLGDELRAMGFINIMQQSDETYEQCLERRAKAELRKQEILSQLCDF